MTINDFLRTRYVRGGREGDALDCWGLVRIARHELFGRPLLPLCADAQPGDFRAITTACEDVSALERMRAVDPAPGAIATGWSGSLCLHVGLVVFADGRIWILETDEPTGPCLTPLREFSRRYVRVVFYDD